MTFWTGVLAGAGFTIAGLAAMLAAGVWWLERRDRNDEDCP